MNPIVSKLKTYLKQQSTGQIVVKFTGESHLLKINIENGNIVSISMGNRTQDEILNVIKEREIEDLNFIQGIKPIKKNEQPITEEVLKALGITIESISQETLSGREIVSYEKIKSVIEHFIDLVGPLGPVLVENIFKKLGYERGQPMNGDVYNEFVSRLSEEIPEEKRILFKNKIS